MDIVELRRRLIATVIRTKKSLAGVRAGQFRTLRRGSGSDFDQLRDYMPGDDIRFIDWKSSARSERLVMRQYRDERSRILNLVIDSSSSMNYGTGLMSGLEAAFHVATILAVIAELTGDAVGLYVVSDGVHPVLPSAVGPRQTEALVSYCAHHRVGQGAGLGAGELRQLGPLLRQKSMLFLISDFAREASYFDALLPLAARHASFAVRLRSGDEKEALLATRFMRLSGLAAPLAMIPALEHRSSVKATQHALDLFLSGQEESIKRAHVQFLEGIFGQEKRLFDVVMHGLHLAAR